MEFDSINEKCADKSLSVSHGGISLARGKDSEDIRYFNKAYVEKLITSMNDIQYLIDKFYKLESAVRFVGNHYDLTTRHNKLLIRAASTTSSASEKRAKKLTKEQLKDKWLHIDGFNILITLETMLCDGILYKSVDGCVRDLAGMGGSYKTIKETDEAIAMVAAVCNTIPLAGITFYLDQPVSNSGKLKSHILSLSEAFDCPVEVEVVRNPDVILYDKECVISTDTVILEKCLSWFHLHEEVMQMYGYEVTVDFQGGN